MPDFIEKEPRTGAKAGEFWQDTFDRALRFRGKHWNGEKAWRRYLDLYRGNHWKVMQQDSDDVSSDSVRERVTVNITGSTVQNMLPFLIRKRPKFMLQPRRPEFVVSARLQQEVLNYCWREFDMQRQARRAILDAVVLGHGIIKTGFNLEVDESIDSAPTTIEYRDYIRKEEPFVRRVSPFFFVFDPEAPEFDLNSARWCAEIIIKPLRDVIDNKLYSDKVRKQLRDGKVEPTRVESLYNWKVDSDLDFGDEHTDFSETNRDRVVLFELWDKRSGKYFVFAHGVHEPLIEQETWPYDYLDGFPYLMVPFIPMIDEPFPLGLPAFMEDQQHELNRTRTAMFQHRRRFNRKYMALEGEIDDAELTKLVNGEDGTVIIARNRDAVVPLADAPLPSDQYQVEGVIKQDIQELTGSDELIRGGSLPSRTTATEVNTRGRLFGLKLEDRVEQVDNFIVSVGRQVLQHIKANYLTDKVIRLTGEQGNYWVTYSPEDIQGEVDIEMETVSAPQVDPVLDRQQAIQIMQMVMNAYPILAQMGVPINLGELFKWVFEKFEGMKDIQRFFPLAGEISEPLKAILKAGLQAQAQMSAAPSVGGPGGGPNNAAPAPGGAEPAGPEAPDLQQMTGGAGQGGGDLMGSLMGMSGGGGF